MRKPQRKRKFLRLPDYDYCQPGAYFVTMVTYQREMLFGQVSNGEMHLNDLGRIALDCWKEIPLHFPHVALDAFVIMPNHVHGILWITEYPLPSVGTTHASSQQASSQQASSQLAAPQPAALKEAEEKNRRPRGPAPGSLGAVVGSYKSAVSKWINRHRDTPGAPVWQRDYYEHIIRTSRALERVREYIRANPLLWEEGKDDSIYYHFRNLPSWGNACPDTKR